MVAGELWQGNPLRNTNFVYDPEIHHQKPNHTDTTYNLWPAPPQSTPPPLMSQHNELHCQHHLEPDPMEDQHTKLLTPSFTATECSAPSFSGRYLTPSFTSTRASASETPRSTHDNKQDDAFDTPSNSDETQEEEKIAQILESELLHDTAGDQTLQLNSREKDIIISELRARIIALEERNARLQAALEEQLQPHDDDDHEREHSLGGYRPLLTADNLLQAGSTLAQKPSSVAPDDRAKRLASTSTGSSTSSESCTPEDREERDDGGTGRTFADSTPQEIQRQRWQLPKDPNPTRFLRNNTTIERSGFNFKSRFTFEALVGFSATGIPILTGLDELPDSVLYSVSLVLDIIASGSYGKAKIPSQPSLAPANFCAFHWMSRNLSRGQWTMHKPGDFACAGCARGRRVCFRWMRAGVWRLLPLPEELRPEGVTYKDEAFWMQSFDPCMFGIQTECLVWAPRKLQAPRKSRKAVKDEVTKADG